MNPFELTKDPDGGGTTVRVKHDFVVLTREEEKQITERITEILTENAKLRELVAEMYEAVKCCCDECWFGYSRNPAKCENENCGYRKEYVAMRELGVEVDE